MAYTIIRSNGNILTTIQDGTIDTGNTSLGLPGRSYSGYGQAIDTNFVRQLESFASSSPPANPLKGQLWFNTTTNTLNVCPADKTLTASSWLTLASTSVTGTATLANVTITGNLLANNVAVTNGITGDAITVRIATVSGNLTASKAIVTTANLGAVNTQTITTGGPTSAGVITGSWSSYGSTTGNALAVITGNVSFAVNSTNGIKCDNYMYANGDRFNPTGTYDNTSVSNYLTGAGNVTQFKGNIAPAQITTTRIAGGGTIAGTWTLETGARFQATFADLAERFAADNIYDTGTVVEIGGDKEVTAVVDELSDKVFGVVSHSAAYLMNAMAGSDETHPAIAIGGRVPVKVMGAVTKGDRLVSAGNGYARAAKEGEAGIFNTIGRSLVTKTSDDAGVVEAIVIIK